MKIRRAARVRACVLAK